MADQLGVHSPTRDDAQASIRIDVADLVIPSHVDIVLVARHYYPAFGGLQNFTARLAAAFHHLGHRPLVVSLEEPPNARTVLGAPADQVVPEVHVVSEDRSLFWRRLPAVLQRSDSTTVVLAVGLEQKTDVSTQLHALAEIAVPGRISVLRIATTNDFACRVNARLIEECKYLHAIVVLNSAMQAEVERALPHESRCIVQRLPVIGCALRNSTDPNILRQRWRHEQNISMSTFVALWAGRPVRRKRLRKLIRIWSESCVKGVLVLAGVDPESESREAQDVVSWVREQTGMDIRLLPPVPPDAMTTLYSAADCFLFTSEREGMSNAVVEALSHGLPVLASDIPGVRDIQTFHSAAALELFTELHENEFVRALQKEAARHACSGQYRRERDPEACRIFGAKAVALRYIDLFERLQPVSIE
jgi:glycosyltransferase involved in cell wall biosynthesis